MTTMTTKTTPDLMAAWKTVADQLRDWEELARLTRRDAHASEDKIRFGQLERNIADARSMLRHCVFDFEDMVNMMEGATP